MRPVSSPPPITPLRGAARGAAVSAKGGDAALVASIGGGDLSGLGELFDRHGDDVRRLLARLGISNADVDDLVQQTFLDVPRAAARFHPDGTVKPWLFGLAAMVARRHRRVLARMVTRLHKWTTELSERRTVTPAETFELGVEAKRAQRALDSLSAKKREAFVLVALEGMTGDEAAAALHVPVATVWTRLHYARSELKRALTETE
jgi:RNA polymerase sigma-70 factor (ECF subfamily)